MKIAKGTLKSHHVCVIRDSKYVTKGVKCYNSGSLLVFWSRFTMIAEFSCQGLEQKTTMDAFGGTEVEGKCKTTSRYV